MHRLGFISYSNRLRTNRQLFVHASIFLMERENSEKQCSGCRLMMEKRLCMKTEKEVSMIPHTDVQVENIEFILKNPRLLERDAGSIHVSDGGDLD